MLYPVLIGAGALIAVVGGICATKYALRRNAKQDKLGVVCRAAEGILPPLEKNLRKLESGDLGWRRLGHGKDIIHLSCLTPKEGTEKAQDFAVLREEQPETGQQIEKHDEHIWDLRDAATKLATTIQGQVRKQFEHDRAVDDSALRNVSEDSWLLILQGLINDGQFEDGLKGKIGAYWAKRKVRYQTILAGYGGPHRHRFEELEDELEEIERDLRISLQRIIATAKYQQ